MTTQPLRVGIPARRRLARLARRDAAAVHDTEPDRADATTPTVATLQARADELSALINSHFTAAQLRAARMFDRSDEKTALYWGALREATAGRVAPRPPALRRPEWLTARGTAVDALHPISASRTVDTIRE